jgi:hypothetical protein
VNKSTETKPGNGKMQIVKEIDALDRMVDEGTTPIPRVRNQVSFIRGEVERLVLQLARYEAEVASLRGELAWRDARAAAAKKVQDGNLVPLRVEK